MFLGPIHLEKKEKKKDEPLQKQGSAREKRKKKVNYVGKEEKDGVCYNFC